MPDSHTIPPGPPEPAGRAVELPKQAGDGPGRLRLRERYGRDAGRIGGYRPRPVRRWQVLVLVVAVLAVATAVFWVVMERQRESVQSGLYSWQAPADGVIAVVIEVDRPSDTPVTCELIAVDDRHVVVGQLVVEIPEGGERRQYVDAEIPLRGDGIAPELIGCHATP